MKYTEFENALTNAFYRDPVVHGYVHPMENFLDEFLKNNFPGKATKYFRKFITDYIDNRVGYLENFLLCLRSQEPVGGTLFAEWLLGIMKECLQHPNTEIREAALLCLEYYGKQSLSVLRKHVEEEKVFWLQQYTQQVIKDLSQ